MTDSTDPTVPRLADVDAVLFDLDGVLTPTAEVHMHAWQTVFDELFDEWGIHPAYTERDYYEHVDGKRRYDGVAGVLRSRDVEAAWGDPSDDPSAQTVCGVGNRKNAAFLRVLERDGIAPYPGSLAVLEALERAGTPVAVVSSSKNAGPVLDAAGLRDRFSVIIDGLVAEQRNLPSKPAPDVFLEGARALGVDPARAAVIEDALAGVASGAAGGFGLVIGVDRGVGADALADVGAHLIVTDLADLLEVSA
ncbi:HAD family hydrolase [Microbacterium suaedae]|uniref:HAD family hydrolase n=1 Tax=Microbacterium suaedae TaxID=2067813 RepID=UPI000DA17A9E|nr:beta-phosphoglucomutase family hydrolase [Microbacterium suaedae]